MIEREEDRIPERMEKKKQEEIYLKCVVIGG